MHLLIICCLLVIAIGTIIWKKGYYQKLFTWLGSLNNYVDYINKLKDRWLESKIKLYADDVRSRYPHQLTRTEKLLAPVIIRNYTGTVANLISIIRILLAINVFLLLIIASSVNKELSLTLVIAALIIFIAASFLDFLDGPAARALNQISKTGKILDPAADKLLLASVFIIMGWIYLPALTFWLVAGQELFLIIITLLKTLAAKLPFEMATQANMFGKIKNIFELTAGGLLFLCPLNPQLTPVTNVLFLISVPLAIGSIIGYLSSIKRKNLKRLAA
jgi:CDP-diacylglycerol--glycerol-3-phosphate 3-phosphatidyltransferase